MILFAVLGILGAGAVIIIGTLFLLAMGAGGAAYGSTVVQGIRKMTGDASPADDPPPFGW